MAKSPSDYVSRPRTSGCRALHIVVAGDGCLIEIQPRTKTMHAWAQLVEQLSGMTQTNHKQDGSSVLQQYLALVSQVDAHREGLGPAPTDEDLDMLGSLGDEALRQLRAIGL